MDSPTHWTTPAKKVSQTGLEAKVSENLGFPLFHSHPPADKLDEEVVQDGVKVFIDKKAQLSLLGERK